MESRDQDDEQTPLCQGFTHVSSADSRVTIRQTSGAIPRAWKISRLVLHLKLIHTFITCCRVISDHGILSMTLFITTVVFPFSEPGI